LRGKAKKQARKRGRNPALETKGKKGRRCRWPKGEGGRRRKRRLPIQEKGGGGEESNAQAGKGIHKGGGKGTHLKKKKKIYQKRKKPGEKSLNKNPG